MSESSNPRGGESNPATGARLPFGTLAGCIAITAIVAGGAVIAAPENVRPGVGIGAGVAAVLLCAAITAAAYFRSRIEPARREGAARAGHAEARTAAIITEAEARLADGQQRIQALTDVVTAKTREAKESENRRAAAMAAFAGAAGRMQAMSTSMLAELREMEHRHGDPKVLADLLELDHRTAQAGRLADSIAVLSGARSGRRWAKPIAMESILRGAMGRVAGYQRVRLRAVTEIAIAGHAAEGVMHALAELLDNACNFSPPTTEVHVYAAEVPAGVVITIEDSGLVMSESALRRAELTVSGKGANASGFGGSARGMGDSASGESGNSSGVGGITPGASRGSEGGGRNSLAGGGISDLSSLSGTRLGLAVVGYLARKHDLTVSYRPSAIGGTAVVVVVPRELTTRIDRTPGALGSISLPVHSPTELPLGATPTTASSASRSDTAPALLTVDVTRTAPAAAVGADPTPTGPLPRRAEIYSGTASVVPTPEPPAPSGDPAEAGPPPGSAETLSGTASSASGEAGSTAPVFFGDDRTSADPIPLGASASRGDTAVTGLGQVVKPAGAAEAVPGDDRNIADTSAGFSGSTAVLADRLFDAGTNATPASAVAALPKRQRGKTLAAVHPEGLAAPDTPAGGVARPVSPAAMGAFQRAVSGRENAGTANPSALESDK
nr:ATP-binding protein [Nocardia sp. SYP-A9097]